jgi:hypothetical protein
MPLMLSTPMVGGRKPDLRLSLSGKLMLRDRQHRHAHEERQQRALAVPTSSSWSSRMLAARMIQSGIQPGPSSGRQVV